VRVEGRPDGYEGEREKEGGKEGLLAERGYLLKREKGLERLTGGRKIRAMGRGAREGAFSFIPGFPFLQIKLELGGGSDGLRGRGKKKKKIKRN